MKAAGRRNKAKGWPLGLALLISAAHAVVGDTGDFAPLAVGNTWVYTFQVQAGGFGWNPSGQHLGRRTLRVESRGEASGGDPVYVLSFRDSLYARWLGPVKRATGADYSLPDTVEAGRFQLVDSAVYARDVGLFFYRRRYDLLGEAHIPGYVFSEYRLASFNGRVFSGFSPAGAVGGAPVVEDFTGFKTGRSWRYRGLRHQVIGTAGVHFRRDSVDRKVVVTGVTFSGGRASYRLSLRDSLYRRSYDGQPLADGIEAGTISVDPAIGGPFSTATADLSTTESQDDAVITFKWQSFLAEDLRMHDFGGGPVRTAEYRESYPGILEDTLIHAEGIGLVRRSRLLLGADSNHRERIDMRLVELDGKPFEAMPVTILPGGASASRPIRLPATAWRWIGRLRDLLGRIERP